MRNRIKFIEHILKRKFELESIETEKLMNHDLLNFKELYSTIQWHLSNNSIT